MIKTYKVFNSSKMNLSSAYTKNTIKLTFKDTITSSLTKIKCLIGDFYLLNLNTLNQRDLLVK